MGNITSPRRIIIIGGGRVGRHAAVQLSLKQDDVTVIERDSTNCEKLSKHPVNQIIEGDGTNEDVLQQTDPANADTIAALTDDTTTNVSICEMVDEIAPDVRTLVRITRDGEQDLGHRRPIDSVVYPSAAGARAAVNQITEP